VPFKLSGFPVGLLGLLDSQNLGETPRDLNEVIVPTVDLTEFYALPKGEPEIAIIAAPANGFNVGVTVPDREVWRINFGGAFAITDVGDSFNFAPAVNFEAGVVPIGKMVAIAASQQRFSVASQLPIFVPSGSVIGVYIAELVGVPTAVSVALGITRLRK